MRLTLHFGGAQDAIKCDWPEFIKAMPHLETKIQDDGSYANGMLVFRMKPLVPVHDRKMFIKSFTVKSRRTSGECVIRLPAP